MTSGFFDKGGISQEMLNNRTTATTTPRVEFPPRKQNTPHFDNPILQFFALKLQALIIRLVILLVHRPTSTASSDISGVKARLTPASPEPTTLLILSPPWNR